MSKKIVSAVADLRETTYDTPTVPKWRTYESAGVTVTYEDGSTAYLSMAKLQAEAKALIEEAT